ncbi:chorismate-binding protein [Synechococcus sp. BSF8S]|uniref:chromophore lyase CpcT/CpeT n=1 Tax=Synechococcales TaxID=1890424 RepID=UPI001627F74D|nr:MULTISPECIES: chromophore lyase CpcT/CpeT [unclassified Synechococcus]MBC1259703.1 chorismate-binding protein [Synechococcus sp. BSF8S]MBC1262874.1 chorismate-binding protein [Synechococcus sp. BSA11S]
MTSSLPRLVRMLSAGFSNQDQAFENPPIYAHILVRFRPLQQLDPGSLLLEQSYAFAPGQPYRIRVLRAACAEDGSLRIQNHAIHDERRFWGAVEDPERMAQIQPEDLRLLEGCTYVVREQGEGFVGEVEPGCRCLVERKGATAYLVSSFELDGQSMRTIDRGHDPATHDQLWGSLAGPFEFQRTDDFSAEIPGAWLERWAS